MQNVAKNNVGGAKRKWLPRAKEIPFILMWLPALVSLFLFTYLPLFGLLMAFNEYDPLLGMEGFWRSPWASGKGGIFNNFVQIFETPGMKEAIINTITWNIGTLLISFPLPLIFALLLDEINNAPFKRAVQTISYMPHFISFIVAAALMRSLIGDYGVINDLIMRITGSRIGFTADPDLFYPMYLFITVWKSVGWDSILYLSAITGVSPDLYEAAKIDGAGRFKQVWFVTLPELIPTAVILLITKVGGILGSNFELVHALQKGSAAWTDDVLSTVIYKYGLEQGKYSMSTAVNLFQGLVALVFTLGANWTAKKVANIGIV